MIHVYSTKQLKEMKELQVDRVNELKRMYANEQFGAYKNIDEVEKALKFEQKELKCIEDKLKVVLEK